MRAVDLRAEHRTDPRGIDTPVPRLTWSLASTRPGDHQTGYRLLVATSTERLAPGLVDLWDTGPVTAPWQPVVDYAGAELAAGAAAVWSVQVRDATGEVGEWAEPARFELGRLGETWGATWIGAPGIDRVDPASFGVDADAGWTGIRPVVFSRAFELAGSPRRARAHVAARGLYALRCNGRRVGAAHLTPGWTDYSVRIPYQVLDVTDLLREGSNRVDVEVAAGWFAGRVAWVDEVWGSATSVLAELVVETDTGVERIGTGPDWDVRPSVRLWADLVMGEAIDLALPTAAPVPATVVAPPAGVALVAHPGPFVEEVASLPPHRVERTPDGDWLVDFGQNHAGRLRLTVPPAGRPVVLRHAEVRDEAGRLATANLRTAAATDVIVPGAVASTVEPQFTIHGYRYASISGLDDPPAVESVVLSSAVRPAGTFRCSDELVNRLHENIVWSQRSNFVEVPTDCPQRDERLGWTADIGVFAPSACWNADVVAFLEKWLADLRAGMTADGAYRDVAPIVLGDLFAEAAPGWGDAGVSVPWTLYERTGDLRILRDNYPAMSRWVDYVAARNPDGLWSEARGHDYGDWLNADEDTPREMLATAVHHASATRLARIADLLGRSADAARFRARADLVATAFAETFVTPRGRLAGHTQTGYALALAGGLIPPHLVDAAVSQLVDLVCRPRGLGSAFVPGHATTGFIGVQHLLPVLCDHGHVDLAYRILLNEDYPSWGHTIRHGATTIWERWNGWTERYGFAPPGMNSFNHYSLGSVGDWLYRYVGGLRPIEPGFGTVLVAPAVHRALGWAEVEHRSVRGPMRVAWRAEGARFELTVELPPGVVGRVRLPTVDAASVVDRAGPVDPARLDVTPDAVMIRVEGGRHDLCCVLSPLVPGPTVGPVQGKD